MMKVPNKPLLNHKPVTVPESPLIPSQPILLRPHKEVHQFPNAPASCPSPRSPLLFLLRSHAWGWLGAMVGNRAEVAQLLTPSFGCK